MPNLAVLITCYNRKHDTLRCLRDLFGAQLPPTLTLSVYLVDDASPDGTGDAVRSEFPSVQVLNGSGQLFWGGGMRLAFSEAIKARHHFYLWLNDDVELFPDAIVKLVNTYSSVIAKGQVPAIVVGAACDPANGQLTYGGRRRKGWHPLKIRVNRS